MEGEKRRWKRKENGVREGDNEIMWKIKLLMKREMKREMKL